MVAVAQSKTTRVAKEVIGAIPSRSDVAIALVDEDVQTVVEQKEAIMDPSLVECLAPKHCDNNDERVDACPHKSEAMLNVLERVVGRYWQVHHDWEGFPVWKQEAMVDAIGRALVPLFMFHCAELKGWVITGNTLLASDDAAIAWADRNAECPWWPGKITIPYYGKVKQCSDLVLALPHHQHVDELVGKL